METHSMPTSEQKWAQPIREYSKDIVITPELQFNVLNPQGNAKEVTKLQSRAPEAEVPDDAVIWKMHFLANGDPLRGTLSPDSLEERQKNLADFFRGLKALSDQYTETNGFDGYAPQFITGTTNKDFASVLTRSAMGFVEVPNEDPDDPEVYLYHPDFPAFVAAIPENPLVKRYSR
jgi:hypothetical protein